MYAQNIPIIDLKTCSKHEQDVPCPTHFEYLIARIKIQQKLFISSFLSFDKNSISIRGRNEGVGGEGKRNVKEKEWNYTMSRHKRVVPLSRLFTAQCTPACIHAERVYAAQLTTISASFHNASTHVQREDVYAYAAIIVCPARSPLLLEVLFLIYFRVNLITRSLAMRRLKLFLFSFGIRLLVLSSRRSSTL